MQEVDQEVQDMNLAFLAQANILFSRLGSACLQSFICMAGVVAKKSSNGRLSRQHAFVNCMCFNAFVNCMCFNAFSLLKRHPLRFANSYADDQCSSPLASELSRASLVRHQGLVNWWFQ